jgi:lactoylglutathione lyase
MNRIVHLALKVDDLERTTEFYQKVFGFKEMNTEKVRDHTSRHLSDGVLDVALIKYDAGTQSAESRASARDPCIHHFAVEVDSVDAATKQITSYGCEIISDPGVIPVKFRAPGGTVCELVPKGRYKKPIAAKKSRRRRREESSEEEAKPGDEGAQRRPLVGACARRPRGLHHRPGLGLGLQRARRSRRGILPALVRHRDAGARRRPRRLEPAAPANPKAWTGAAPAGRLPSRRRSPCRSLLFKLAGFVVGFAALAFFIVSVMYRRPWPLAAAVAVGLAGGFYLVFPLLLGVNLP